MGKTKKEQARQRRAPQVEYLVECFGPLHLRVEKEQFLSTPVLHVNGPGMAAYRVLNNRFLRDVVRALKFQCFVDLVRYGNYCEMEISRVNPDGTCTPVLNWRNCREWDLFWCYKHQHYLYSWKGGYYA